MGNVAATSTLVKTKNERVPMRMMVEKNIPVPARPQKNGKYREALDAMTVGDCLSVFDVNYQAVYGAVRGYQKKLKEEGKAEKNFVVAAVDKDGNAVPGSNADKENKTKPYAVRVWLLENE